MADPAEIRRSQSKRGTLRATLIRRAVLVPEAGLLIVLLVCHVLLGAPPLTALLGLLLIGWFLGRSLLLLLAQYYLDSANYERAMRLAMQALRMYPFSADTSTLLGNIEMARNRAWAAEAAWRKALRLDPQRAAVYAALSSVLLELEQADEARVAAERALELDPQQAAAYLHLANALTVLGEAPERLEAVLRAGMAVERSAVDALALRCALAYVLLDDGRRSEARLALQGSADLIQHCPLSQRAGLYYHLGALQQMLGDTEQARDYFRTSESLDPRGRHAAAAWRAARS